jgi:hypothetical protein
VASVTTKADLHELVDRLPEGEVDAAARLLTDPFLLSLLSTPEGEVPLSPEEIAGLLEAKHELEQGKGKRFKHMGEAVDWLKHGTRSD